MAKLPALSPEDRALWDALKQEVRPLHEQMQAAALVAEVPKSVTAPAPKPSTPKTQKSKEPELIWQAPGQFAKTLASKPTLARANDLREGGSLGIDRAKADRLRKGKMTIEARIDLHGLTQDQAKSQLESFVALAAKRGQRNLLVITGKGLSKSGQGVLRARVPEWLGQGELGRKVLAFSYAHRKDGEHGALYVLLRRPRG